MHRTPNRFEDKSHSGLKFEFPIIDRKESKTALANFEEENRFLKLVEDAYITALEKEYSKLQDHKHNK